MNQNPYTEYPKYSLRKELPAALVEARALIQSTYHPIAGWMLPASVAFSDDEDADHYPVPPSFNVGVEWAATSALLTPFGRELVKQWESLQTK